MERKVIQRGDKHKEEIHYRKKTQMKRGQIWKKDTLQKRDILWREGIYKKRYKW